MITITVNVVKAILFRRRSRYQWVSQRIGKELGEFLFGCVAIMQRTIGWLVAICGHNRLTSLSASGNLAAYGRRVDPCPYSLGRSVDFHHSSRVPPQTST
jgi:hypothetical protein